MKQPIKKTNFILFWLFLLLLAACGGEEDASPPTVSDSSPRAGETATPQTIAPPLSDSSPTLPFTAVSFTWDDPGIIANARPRLVDISSDNADIILKSPAATETAVGLFAADSLTNPSLDGRTLISTLPVESSLTIQPDGTAVFAAWDVFDPYWRGRQPQWEQIDLEEGPVTIDYLADDPQAAKVFRTAVLGAATEMLFLRNQEDQISFYWSGSLRYCYDFGRPVQSLSLSDPSGRYHTAFQVAPGFSIRLSAGEDDWITVWEAEEEGWAQPDIALPAALQGAESLCLEFGSGPDDFYTAEQLYLTIRLAADDLAGLTRFPVGERTLTFTGQGNGAILFWDDPTVTTPAEPPDYPTDAPTVVQTGDTLRIAFPSGILLEFPLKDGMPGSLSRLVIGGQTIFQAPPGADWTPPAVITLLEGDPEPLPANFDWAAYRDAALADGAFPPAWESLWTRTQRPFSLADAHFSGAQVEGEAAELNWSISTPDGAGRVIWTFYPYEIELAGTTMTGVGMQARLTGEGLAAAERIAFTFPLLLSPGDRQIEQTFRQMIEAETTLQADGRYPDALWFGQNQSFAFHTGPGRTVLGLFAEPTWAKVRQQSEGGRHFYTFDLPLPPGKTRETTPLYWLAAPAGTSDRLTAATIWGRFYEEIRAAYLAETGIHYTRPLPTVVWNLPLEEQLFPALEHFVATGEYPPVGESWFDWYTQNQLPRAAAAGIQNVIIQAPWLSDGEDPELVASLHAPRDFIVSPLLGGQAGLKRLVAEAHRQGIQVTLWYPSSFSLYSPLPQQYPERITWRMNGVPEDWGWGDIFSLNKYEPHRQYVLDKLTTLRQDVPFDGLWLDSWVGLAVPTDYAEAQPFPQLDEAAAFLRAFSEMGLSQIVIEG
ncbi:MAG: hypothetical protein D6793_10055, partial [Thermoflexia bacterium]